MPVLLVLGVFEPLKEIVSVLVNVKFAAHHGMTRSTELSTSQLPDHAGLVGLLGFRVIAADFLPSRLACRWVNDLFRVVLRHLEPYRNRFARQRVLLQPEVRQEIFNWCRNHSAIVFERPVAWRCDERRRECQFAMKTDLNIVEPR